MTEGIDYFVKLMDFPNYASRAVCLENEDGTYTVYCNSRYTFEQIKERLLHELKHMEGSHHQDPRLVTILEEEAG